MLRLQAIDTGEILFISVLLVAVFLFIFCLYLIDKNIKLLDEIYMQNKKIQSNDEVLSDINSLISKFNRSLIGKE